MTHKTGSKLSDVGLQALLGTLRSLPPLPKPGEVWESAYGERCVIDRVVGDPPPGDAPWVEVSWVCSRSPDTSTHNHPQGRIDLGRFCLGTGEPLMLRVPDGVHGHRHGFGWWATEI